MNAQIIKDFFKRFKYYKSLGDQTFVQLPSEAFFWQYNEESNSIAIIVQHMAGNMLSRWTDFLTTDGEKNWRNRDSEFEPRLTTKEEVIQFWEKGWECFFNALEQVNETNLFQNLYIRSEPLTVFDALLRQLAHYPYHIGQIIYIAKMIKNQDWTSLSIPRNQSEGYNQEMHQKSR